MGCLPPAQGHARSTSHVRRAAVTRSRLAVLAPRPAENRQMPQKQFLALVGSLIASTCPEPRHSRQLPLPSSACVELLQYNSLPPRQQQHCSSIVFGFATRAAASDNFGLRELGGMAGGALIGLDPAGASYSANQFSYHTPMRMCDLARGCHSAHAKSVLRISTLDLRTLLRPHPAQQHWAM